MLLEVLYAFKIYHTVMLVDLNNIYSVWNQKDHIACFLPHSVHYIKSLTSAHFKGFLFLTSGPDLNFRYTYL
jgi:hypothetical protein